MSKCISLFFSREWRISKADYRLIYSLLLLILSSLRKFSDFALLGIINTKNLWDAIIMTVIWVVLTISILYVIFTISIKRLHDLWLSGNKCWCITPLQNYYLIKQSLTEEWLLTKNEYWEYTLLFPKIMRENSGILSIWFCILAILLPSLIWI